MAEPSGPEVVVGVAALLHVPGIDEGHDESTRAALAGLRAHLTGQLPGPTAERIAAAGERQPSPGAFAEELPGLVAGLGDDPEVHARMAGALTAAEQVGVPGAPAVLSVHAAVLGALDRHEEALALFDEVLARVPEAPDALFQSAVALRRLERGDEAAERLGRARSRPGVGADDHAAIARELLRLGALDEARAAADDALRLAASDPLAPEQALDLSDAYEELGLPESALAVLGPLLAGEGRPDTAEVHAGLVAARLLLMDIGDGDRAARLLRRLEQRLGSLEGEPLARLWLGQALRAQGRDAEALELLDEELADRVPTSMRGWALHQRGAALADVGDAAGAEPLL
ncbi:MAG TPA: tetratricopeptide repeat protein, partial [Acidimicrobiales bacterium]